MTSDKPLRIGIAGLGTVGSGLLALLNEHSDAIAEKGGRPILITGVCARSRAKPAAKLTKAVWFEDPRTLAVSADIDVFVELMGGDKGPALESVKAALRAGKHGLCQALAFFNEPQGYRNPLFGLRAGSWHCRRDSLDPCTYGACLSGASDFFERPGL